MLLSLQSNLKLYKVSDAEKLSGSTISLMIIRPKETEGGQTFALLFGAIVGGFL